MNYQRLIGCVCSAFLITSMSFADIKIKKPNVSGQFYSADAKTLAADIVKYFSEASVSPYAKAVDIVIAPHAGYMYSGGVAAYSFKAVSKKQYKTVVILAPSHFFGFRGVSIWNEGGFETPLGIVEVDQDFANALIAADDAFYFEPGAFAREHSLEVEIPFLQKIFHDFKIVPVVMGQPSFDVLERFAENLDRIIGQRDGVLVVVSTDFSHYHDDATARQMDQEAITAIAGLKAEEIYKGCLDRSMEMCGCMPVTASLLLAKIRGLKNVDVLKYANSGDISGDRNSVVGYASIAISSGAEKPASPGKEEGGLNVGQKKILLEVARETMEAYVRDGKRLDFDITDPRLQELEGAFVTIHKKGQLRGCIGHIIGRQPLCVTVRDMAIASATEDPRFKPVTADELDELDVEVSVLSKPKVIRDIAEIELGKHGVIISRGRNHGVFLPQVAEETGWDKEQFLSVLSSQKAGLRPDAWKDPETKIEIFTADVFSEKDLR